jgi:hypothetical protein
MLQEFGNQPVSAVLKTAALSSLRGALPAGLAIFA